MVAQFRCPPFSFWKIHDKGDDYLEQPGIGSGIDIEDTMDKRLRQREATQQLDRTFG